MKLDTRAFEAGETHLHRVAKTYLEDRAAITLPPLVVQCEGLCVPVQPETDIEAHKVALEIKRGKLRPDALLQVGCTDLAVEFRVTHGVSRQKAAAYRRLGLSVIEIDLSQIWDTRDVEDQAEAILHLAPRRWVFNRVIHGVEVCFARYIKTHGSLDLRGRDVLNMARSQMAHFGPF